MAKGKRRPAPDTGKPKFDCKVHTRDKETGEVVTSNPYQKVCEGNSSYYLRGGLKYDGAGNLLPGQKVPEAPKEAAKAREASDVEVLKEQLRAALSANAHQAKENDDLRSDLKEAIALLKANAAVNAAPAPQVKEPAKPAVDEGGAPLAPTKPSFPSDENAAADPPSGRRPEGEQAQAEAPKTASRGGGRK